MTFPGVVVVTLPGVDFGGIEKVTIADRALWPPKQTQQMEEKGLRFTLSQDNRELRIYVPEESIALARAVSSAKTKITLKVDLHFGADKPSIVNLTLNEVS